MTAESPDTARAGSSDASLSSEQHAPRAVELHDAGALRMRGPVSEKLKAAAARVLKGRHEHGRYDGVDGVDHDSDCEALAEYVAAASRVAIEERRALLAGLVRIHNDKRFKLGWIEQSIIQEACEALSLAARCGPEWERAATEKPADLPVRYEMPEGVKATLKQADAAPEGIVMVRGSYLSRICRAALANVASVAWPDAMQFDKGWADAYVVGFNDGVGKCRALFPKPPEANPATDVAEAARPDERKTS